MALGDHLQLGVVHFADQVEYLGHVVPRDGHLGDVCLIGKSITCCLGYQAQLRVETEE